MKRLAVNTIVTLATSLCLLEPANASGFIMVDPVTPQLAMLPGTVRPVTPPVMPRVRPPVRPPHVRPPVTPTPPNPPVLHGSVSYGLHMQSEAIKVDITEQVAKTYITQTFVNNTDRDLAGTYLFPLPDDTTFSSFSLHIDGKPVEGKILEANEARQQYEAIVRSLVDPGLLEYADYKTVRARIFPIPAHGTKKVELEYTQVLRAENGLLKYRFPLKSEGQSAAADEIKVDVKLATAQGLRTIWSPSHTISAQRSDDHHAKVSLLQRNTVPDKDFLLYYSVSDKELSANLLTHKDKDEGDYGYFLLTLTPPVQAKQAIAKDIVLVADTSGSMSGAKMQQNQKALKYVVNALNAGDRFNIVQFNTDVEKFRSQLVLATAENKKAAISYIDEMEARGGTNIGDALKTGKSMLNQASERPAYLVFMTDGEPTVGETDVSKLIKSVDGARDIRIFDFGVGYDVNTKLLNKLAENNHGTAQYVEPDEDIESSVSGLYQKIKSPVLSDVGITYEGIQVKDIYPREVKDIFAGSQVLLIGKYKGSGKASVRLTGKVQGVTKAYSFPLSFAAEEVGHTYLPRLWAMRRIGHLTDVAQDNGNTKEVVDEIIALSKKYGIISAYTSFLVTDPAENERLRNRRGMPVPAGGIAPMLQGATNGTIGPMASEAPAALPKPQSKAGFGGMSGWFGGKKDGLVAFAPPRMRTGGVAQSLAIAPADASLFRAEETGGLRSAMDMAAPAAPPPLVTSGRGAVLKAKRANEFREAIVASNDRDDKTEGVKSVEDKTFYLRGGFWTDSTYDAGKSPKPEVVTFGTSQYFDLLHKAPGISKYLAVGKQVIVVFKGHTYKVVSGQAG